MSTDPDCLFCNIVSGDVPADIVAETEHTVAFRDINAQAPTHVLVIPRTHEPNLAALADADADAALEVMRQARAIAEMDGLESYRLVFNTGADAHQTVFHAHMHVLGGRSFGWPPG